MEKAEEMMPQGPPSTLWKDGEMMNVMTEEKPSEDSAVGVKSKQPVAFCF